MWNLSLISSNCLLKSRELWGIRLVFGAAQELGLSVDGSKSAEEAELPLALAEPVTYLLMVQASELIGSNKMMRVEATTLPQLISSLVEKLGVELAAGEQAKLGLVEPGRTDPAWLNDLEALPKKAKVQLSKA